MRPEPGPGGSGEVQPPPPDVCWSLSPAALCLPVRVPHQLNVKRNDSRRADPARSGSSETPHYGAHRTWTASAVGRLARPRSRACVPLENERLIAEFLQFKTLINYRENQRWTQKINAVPVASFRYRLISTQEPPRLLTHQPLKPNMWNQSRRLGLEDGLPVRSGRVWTPLEPSPRPPSSLPVLSSFPQKLRGASQT